MFSWASGYHLVVKLVLSRVSRDFRRTPQEWNEYLGAATTSLLSSWGKSSGIIAHPDFC